MEAVLSFDQGRGLSSGAIGWFAASSWSHTDAVTPRGLLGARSDRIGGKPAGVWPRPVGYGNPRSRVRMALTCTAAQYERWLNFLYAQIDKPYDALAIFAFVIDRNWRDEDSWFCSELQARALEVAGILPVLCLTPNKITPGALALAVSAAGGQVITT